MKKIVLLMTAVFLMAGSAFAGPKFTLIGNVNYGKPTVEPAVTGVTYKEGMGLGGGLLLGFAMGAKSELEIGAIYAPIKAEVNITSPITSTIKETLTGIEIPLMFRFKLNPTFNLGVGGYYWMAQGDVAMDTDGVASTKTYAVAQLKTADYGVKAGLGINIGALVINANYVMGMANMDDSGVAGASSKNTAIQGQVGFRFGGSK